MPTFELIQMPSLRRQLDGLYCSRLGLFSILPLLLAFSPLLPLCSGCAVRSDCCVLRRALPPRWSSSFSSPHSGKALPRCFDLWLFGCLDDFCLLGKYWKRVLLSAIVIDRRMGSRAFDVSHAAGLKKLGRLYPSLLLGFFCIIYVSLVVIFIIANYVPWTWVDD